MCRVRWRNDEATQTPPSEIRQQRVVGHIVQFTNQMANRYKYLSNQPSLPAGERLESSKSAVSFFATVRINARGNRRLSKSDCEGKERARVLHEAPPE